MSDALITAKADGVLTLTLNRPEKRNALSFDLIAGLAEGIARAELEADVRVVVVRGAGKDFCAGADLQELLASADRSIDENERVCATLTSCPTSATRLTAAWAFIGLSP